jgi:hypothetical protein
MAGLAPLAGRRRLGELPTGNVYTKQMCVWQQEWMNSPPDDASEQMTPAFTTVYSAL